MATQSGAADSRVGALLARGQSEPSEVAQALARRSPAGQPQLRPGNRATHSQAQPQQPHHQLRQKQQQQQQQQHRNNHHHELADGHQSAGGARQRRSAAQANQRDEWLAQWAHIWAHRPAPDWQPRRASVDGCQLRESSDSALAYYRRAVLHAEAGPSTPTRMAAAATVRVKQACGARLSHKQHQRVPVKLHKKAASAPDTVELAQSMSESPATCCYCSCCSDSSASSPDDQPDLKAAGKPGGLDRLAELDGSAAAAAASVPPEGRVGDKLRSQDEQRKFLIISMALRQLLAGAEDGSAAGATKNNSIGADCSSNTQAQRAQLRHRHRPPARETNCSCRSGADQRATTADGQRSDKHSAPARSALRSAELAGKQCRRADAIEDHSSSNEEASKRALSRARVPSISVQEYERSPEGRTTSSSGSSSLDLSPASELEDNSEHTSGDQRAGQEPKRRQTMDMQAIECNTGRAGQPRSASASMGALGGAVESPAPARCDVNLVESLIVESWLDDHPEFVRDYFMRKANNQLVDEWLIAHAKVSNSNCESPAMGRRSASPADLARHLQAHQGQQRQSPLHQSLSLPASVSPSPGDSKLLPQQRQRPAHMHTGYSLQHRRSESAQPSPRVPTAPVRKISATQLESRTSGVFLRPMVSTTPDGRPTFLSQVNSGDDDLRLRRRQHLGNPEGASNVCDADEPRTPLQPRKDDERDEGHAGSDDGNLHGTGATGERASRSPSVERNEPDGDELETHSYSDEEVKLIFELVKNICNDLDIRTLLHKILKNIALLINADKSSLFLVRGDASDPNRHLVSGLFNVGQDDTELADDDCITIPWGTGLVGYVAASGESLNIANCYQDPRFTDTIDQRTSYVTKHMLCAPIVDKRGEILGVAQAINKRDGKPFSRSDEVKFARYLQFCGIGLRNAQSYENCQLENRRNQVLLDLARMVFEEQSTIEQVVYRIMLHTQSLLECQRCQVLLLDDGSDDLDQLLQLEPSTRRQLRRQRQALGAGSLTPKPEWRPQCRFRPSTGESGGQDELEPPGAGQPAAEQQVGSLEVHQTPKLFSLVFDLECDGNDLVLHSSRSSQADCTASQPKPVRPFPINIGITGYVLMTGETLNIEDAHQCDRFDPKVDKDSNFRHKSILCMPIRNGQRQIIGVSQLINKKNGRPFNKNDENLFEAFAIFCGLGIHNTLMYEKVLKIMAKQRVTFEVLSYHATAPIEEAQRLNLEPIPSCFALNLGSLKFNDFSLDEQFMLKSCLRFFLDLDLMRRFQIDQLVLCNWILSVRKNYRNVTYHPIVGGNGLMAAPVRYHNWRHAFNVSQMMFAILINTQICQAIGELETLALMIACLCHDLDHRGTNNSFQIKSASPLAQLYSTSTMEHHHFDQCVMILNSKGNQILANLSPDEYSRVIALLEEAILATDLANYFRKRELFFKLVNGSQFDWRHNAEHRSLLRCMLMTACDVAASTKPWPVQKVVADLVMSEFYHQGDIERNELNIEPIDMMNRDKMSKLPQMQIDFIESICAPIYTAFAKLFPRQLGVLLEGCISNRNLWTEMASTVASTASIGKQDEDLFNSKGLASREDAHSSVSSSFSINLKQL